MDPRARCVIYRELLVAVPFLSGFRLAVDAVWIESCTPGTTGGGDAMGFSYRKSVKMGPFRVTASKSGISYSAGVKGVRVTKRANGKVQTTLSAPGTGIRYTTTSGTKGKAKRSAATPPPAAKRSVPAPKAASHPSPSAPKAVSAPKPPRDRRPPRPPKPAPGPRAARPPKPAPGPRAARPPKPAPPPRAARARKPVRLRGRRSTMPPRIPVVPLPITINGNLATVTIHRGGIHIERTRAGGINGNHSADVFWHELAGIDFLEPNFFRNGHVHFATFDDPRGLTSTGNGDRMAASARNPHAILFAWHQSRAYRQLRDLLTGSGPLPSLPHQPPVRQLPTRPASSWAPPQQPPWPQQQPPWPGQQPPWPQQQPPWPAQQPPWP